MRVLVTGAAGFLGSHLVDRLVADRHEVIGLDNLRRGVLSNVQSHVDSDVIDFHVLDVRQQVELESVMPGVDVVYHLAAQSNVMGALDDPDYSFQSNVVGTYNVLKAAGEARVKHLVFASSREVYGEPQRIPAHEGLVPLPKNPYGASKLAGEAYCRVWHETLGLPCTVLRFGNLYGPRDRDRVIPTWIERALLGQDLILYGGEQVLDFVCVETAVEALVRAASCAEFGPINIATGTGTTLEELARRILTSVQTRSRVIIEPARPAEVTRFVADVNRMKTILGLRQENEPLAHLAQLIAVEESNHLMPLDEAA